MAKARVFKVQYHEVRVHFEFRAARDLCCYTGDFLTTPPTPTLSDASLLVDYIYLDSEERRRFAQVGHEYLIEQVQFTGEESVNNSTGKLKLAFNHPTKELVWMVQNGDFNTGKKFLAYHSDATTLVNEAANNLALGMVETTNATAVNPILASGAAPANHTQWQTDDVTVNGITWSFVGGSFDGTTADTGPNVRNNDVLADATFNLGSRLSKVAVNVDDADAVVCVSATHSLTVRDVSRPIASWTTDNRNAWVKAQKDVVVNQHHNTGLSLDGSSNPVQKALLQLNGHDRADEQEGAYYNYVQPFQHHTNTPADGVNVYSFALDPEAHQPSGSANLSRIDNTQLNLWYADSSSTGNTAADGFTHGFLNDFSKVYCYGFSYNVLRIMSGMGGLAYSN